MDVRPAMPTEPTELTDLSTLRDWLALGPLQSAVDTLVDPGRRGADPAPDRGPGVPETDEAVAGPANLLAAFAAIAGSARLFQAVAVAVTDDHAGSLAADRRRGPALLVLLLPRHPAIAAGFRCGGAGGGGPGISRT